MKRFARRTLAAELRSSVRYRAKVCPNEQKRNVRLHRVLASRAWTGNHRG